MIEKIECIEKEIFDSLVQNIYKSFYGILNSYLTIDLPGQIILVRFAAFRDIELKYFGSLDQRCSIAAFNRLRFGDHLLLQGCN